MRMVGRPKGDAMLQCLVKLSVRSIENIRSMSVSRNLCHLRVATIQRLRKSIKHGTATSSGRSFIDVGE